MATRTTTEKRRAWLAGELQAWQGQGLVSPEQAANILSLYGSSEEFAERRHSKALMVLMAAAVLLLGLGVLLVIGYNWEALPRPAKLVLIFGCIAATQATGLWLRFVRKAEVESEAAFLFGCLLYGAGIALVAQIFQINAHYPDGIWWWALGTLPFALCGRTPMLHALVAGLLAFWCGTEVIGDPTRGDWLFGRPGFVPNGAYTFPLLVLPGLAWAYARQSATTVGLYVAAVGWWVILQPVAWHFESNTIYFIGMVGGVLLLASELHPPRSPMAIPYRFFGTALSAGVLVPLSFSEAIEEFSRDFAGKHRAAMVWLAVFAMVAMALLFVCRRALATASPSAGFPSMVRRQWFPLSIMALMFLTQVLSGTSGGWMPVVILINVAMVVMAFWLMQTGLAEDRGRPFFAGVLYFLLWAILRYVDLFGQMGGMLGAAAMFFICGLGLFMVALYWRRRKRGQHA